MKLIIADWGEIDEVLPLVKKYDTGIEIQEYAWPENLDEKSSEADVIFEKIKSVTVRGFHGPFCEMIPSSRDKKVREAARSRFQEAYDIASRLEVQHMVLHTGYIPKTYPRDIWIKNSLDFWSDFLGDKTEGLAIHLENVFEDDFSAIAELIDKTNEIYKREILSACLDIGHVSANSTKSHEEWIKGLGERIKYVHLNSNDGVLDDHWRLGKGKIDVEKVLELLDKYSPTAFWTIETLLNEIEPSVLFLKERGLLNCS
ncbi:sugar phosphate isomerase/epimerase [candidate division WOR-3 bacterium]|nr:sugar phosphate isomerase/epimerase [candidate division WOR-3 bacterium]